MRAILAVSFVITLTGCTGYRNHFDCPPPKGIGCYSVSEIEGMVVETSSGEDVFEPNTSQKCQKCTRKSESRRIKNSGATFEKVFLTSEGHLVARKESVIRRVWIAGEQTPQGNFIDGYFVYFTADTDSWEVLKKKDR